jgi:hypothetical protein
MCSLRTTIVAVLVKTAVDGEGEYSPFHNDAIVFLLSAVHLDQMGD